MLPEDIRIFVRERNPTSSKDASKLADDYYQAQKEGAEGQKKEGDRAARRCLQCGKLGHIAKDCRSKPARPQEQKGALTSTHKHQKKNLSDIECFNCHKKGYYSSNCPHNAMLCTERRVDHRGSLPALERKAVTKPGVMKRGIVEGKWSQEILLDTGCSRTLVHQDLVPEEKFIEGEAVAIRCAHGDTTLYPLAQITMEVDGKTIEVEAAVSSTLPTYGSPTGH